MTPMLELKHVSYSYQSYQEEIFSDVNYQFKNGTFYSIIGQSGAGKSTLLSLLAGLDNPKKGQVLFDGEDIQTKGSSYHRKHHVSLVFQNYNLIDYLTPLENVRLVNKQAGKDILLELGLDETANQTQCPATIRWAATTGGHCACALFQKHLSS